MMKIQTVSIIGLGALGILFGNHFSQKLPLENLRIIADSKRIVKYQSEGIYCNGKPCHFHYMTPEEKCTPADLVIFTVKYQQLQDAIAAMSHQIGENTIILSALNGIVSESDIGKVYGMDKVLYSVAQGMDAVKEGNRLTYHNAGVVCFGEKEPGKASLKTERVAEFFRSVDFPHQVPADMYRQLWGKFMLNVGVNQTVAVFEGNYGTIQQPGEPREIMIAAMREVMTLSEKEGIPLTEADLRYWLDILGTLSPSGKPSMRQDMEAQRYSEVELFAGTVVKLGKTHGIKTPVNQWLYDKVMDTESRYLSNNL